MRPYYEDDFVMLYHGDCREILSTLPTVDLVITDPPYQSLNIEVIRGTTTRLVGPDKFTGKRLAPSRKGGKVARNDWWFETLSDADIISVLDQCRERLSSAGALYVFADVKSGLTLFPPLKPANVLVWDKRRIGMGYSWRRMHEWIAYCPRPEHALRNQGLGDIVRCDTPDDKCHPTEKPTGAVIPLLCNSSDPGQTVLDPFAGSGTTLVAAKGTGRLAIGIEIDERHCEVAAQRISQNVLDFGGAA